MLRRLHQDAHTLTTRAIFVKSIGCKIPPIFVAVKKQFAANSYGYVASDVCPNAQASTGPAHRTLPCTLSRQITRRTPSRPRITDLGPYLMQTGLSNLLSASRDSVYCLTTNGGHEKCHLGTGFALQSPIQESLHDGTALAKEPAMEELFRFAVARAADRTNAETLSLARDTLLQRVLARIAAGEDPWTKLATEAIQYLKNNEAAWLACFGLQLPSPAVLALPEWQGLKLLPALKELLSDLQSVTTTSQPVQWQEQIRKAKGTIDHGQLVILDTQLADFFLVLMIVRSGGPGPIDRAIHVMKLSPELGILLQDHPSLGEVADLLRLIDLLAIKDSDIATLTFGALQARLHKTLLVPPRIFSATAKPLHAIGVIDLLVVKQHIARYEAGEIARIENVLKGESRGHSQKHTLSNERDTTLQTETLTETDQELTSSDHVSLRSEVENTLKEDTKLNAGVHVQYDGGSFKAQSDFTTAYDKATGESHKFSSETAKDITQKAAKKVSQRVMQSETTKIIETFEEDQEQAFDNTKGTAHVVGVYQWVEKVYLAQVFNYGKHLMFDVMVPDPAASFRKQVRNAQSQVAKPEPPPPLGITSPTDISSDPLNVHFYGKLAARLQATGIEPPPPSSITLSASKVVPYEDDTEKRGEETLRIDDGYAALYVRAIASWTRNDNDTGGVGPAATNSFVKLAVGGQQVKFTWLNAAQPGPLEAIETLKVALNPNNPTEPVEVRTISYGYQTNLVDAMILNLEITCVRTPELLAKWQLQTYDKIVARWEKLNDDYKAQMDLAEQQKEDIPILQEADPESNSAIIGTELKRSCIALLDNSTDVIRGLKATDEWSVPGHGGGVDPDLSKRQTGVWVRWFEQAFEWDKIGYVFYPYFWADSAEWVEMLNQKSAYDPLFLKFLKAGFARVTIPVRNGFEDAVNFYMLTGRPWLGGGLPSVGDKTQNPLYLSIVDEMKESSGAPGDEKPVGDPWEIRLPTALIKLRKELDGTTPSWTRVMGPSKAPDNQWTWNLDDVPASP